jgi:hypothetical protein
MVERRIRSKLEGSTTSALFFENDLRERGKNETERAGRKRGSIRLVEETIA